ncbi:MAG: DUF998 domain-containing protein [Haloarculaceae archaeon]
MDTERAGLWLGIAAAVWTLLAIVAATLVSPSFDWSVNALSNLGAHTAVATPTTRLLFDGGLVTGGLAGAAFAATLVRLRANALEGTGAIIAGFALLSMAGVGVFPQSTALHFPAAAGFYLLFSVAAWAYGAGNVQAGARARGVATLLLGTAHLGMWLAWSATGAFARGGVAVPEFAGALAAAAWVVWTARWHLVDRRAGP